MDLEDYLSRDWKKQKNPSTCAGLNNKLFTYVW